MDKATRAELGEKLTTVCDCVTKLFGEEAGSQDEFSKTSFAIASRLFLKKLLEQGPVVDLLTYLSRAAVFSDEFQLCFSPEKDSESDAKTAASEKTMLDVLVGSVDASAALDVLACCKRLKYFCNTGLGKVVRDIIQLVKICCSAQQFAKADASSDDESGEDSTDMVSSASADGNSVSTPNLAWLAQAVQHADVLFRDRSSGLASVMFKDYVISMTKLSACVATVENQLKVDGTQAPAWKSLEEMLKPTTQLAKHLGIAVGNAVTCPAASAALRSRLSARIHFLQAESLQAYQKNLTDLETVDPHAVYPTSIYRRCNGLTLASTDSQTIEAVMSTELTTTIKITRDVLDPRKNTILASVYESIGRVVAIVDDKVDYYGYSDKLEKYFEFYGVTFIKLVYSGNEVDKGVENVEKILVDLKANGVLRSEPLLIVGGGVLADISGFAAALYHRNTPYVMLCTSIVSGIDAGPSPRTCCDGFGYKNLYGAFHPPVLTLTDRMFWKTLHPGWVRHGIAEIIKMAVVKDMSCFELLEKASTLLVETKFGTDMSKHQTRDKLKGMSNAEFQDLCDAIVGKAMKGYVECEYGNLWETHQCRPHAYGHTWSPGYELPSGMLHGHAVGTCMGYGAYLAWKHSGYITQAECDRILDLISDLELALYHPIMDNHEVTYAAQEKIVEKRGGNLCAPVPSGEIGKCGYVNNLDKRAFVETMTSYKAYVLTVRKMPRNGAGVDMHCHDVGLASPADSAKAAMQQEGVTDMTGITHCLEVRPTAKEILAKFGLARSSSKESKTTEKTQVTTRPAQQEVASPVASKSASESFDYNTWIKEKQASRNKDWKLNMEVDLPSDTEHPPHETFKCEFTGKPHVQLFSHDVVEEYATMNTTVVSKNIQSAARVTNERDMFAPCMVGALEAQFLKIQCMLLNAKRVLDVGTFTGMSAIAMAEGCLMGDGMRELVSEKLVEELGKPGTRADASAELAEKILRQNAPVITLECYDETAKVAQQIFDQCEDFVSMSVPSAPKAGSANNVVQLNVGKAVDLRVGKAGDLMRSLSTQIQKGAIPPFDVIFLDADKETYAEYYKIALEGYGDAQLAGTGRVTNMLSANGLILADNSMCAILYDESDFRSQKLHEFNTLVKNDDRVEQVVLTIREGMTMIKPKRMTSYMGPKIKAL